MDSAAKDGPTVVVAEKPSVARDLAAFLGARSRRDGFLSIRNRNWSWAAFRPFPRTSAKAATATAAAAMTTAMIVTGSMTGTYHELQRIAPHGPRGAMT